MFRGLLYFILIIIYYAFADKYISHLNPNSGPVHEDGNRFPSANGNGFIGDINSFGYQPLQEESPAFQYGLGPSRVMDPRLEGSKNLMGSVSELKELVRSYPDCLILCDMFPSKYKFAYGAMDLFF